MTENRQEGHGELVSGESLAKEKEREELYQLSKQSLEGVSHLSEYLEEQGERLFTGMAFLATLAGLLFTALGSLDLFKGRWELIYRLLFFVSALLVVHGSFWILIAVRPFFKKLRGHEPVTSRLFAMEIGQSSKEAWQAFFDRPITKVKQAYIDDQIRETHLIATKVRRKHPWLFVGFWYGFFPASILLFAWFVMSIVGLALQQNKGGSVLIVTDADNTLWDTNQVYARAQAHLLEAVEEAVGIKLAAQDRLRFIREIDQRIANEQKTFRYESRHLVLALGSALSSKAALDESAVNSMAAKYSADLKFMPELRPGVREALTLLRERGVRVVIGSEGSEERIRATLAHYQLADLVYSVEIIAKDAPTFRRLRETNRAELAVAIGDQLDREILAANEAGYVTIYYPGGFEIYGAARTDVKPAHTINKSFAEVTDIVDSLR